MIVPKERGTNILDYFIALIKEYFWLFNETVSWSQSSTFRLRWCSDVSLWKLLNHLWLRLKEASTSLRRSRRQVFRDVVSWNVADVMQLLIERRERVVQLLEQKINAAYFFAGQKIFSDNTSLKERIFLTFKQLRSSHLSNDFVAWHWSNETSSQWVWTPMTKSGPRLLMIKKCLV